MNLGYQSALNLWGGGFDFVVLLNPRRNIRGPPQSVSWLIVPRVIQARLESGVQF